MTIPTNLGEFPPVAPSAIPHRWLDKICRPLEKEEIHAIVESFGKGAYNAKRAGFDGIEVHAVHEGLTEPALRLRLSFLQLNIYTASYLQDIF